MIQKYLFAKDFQLSLISPKIVSYLTANVYPFGSIHTVSQCLLWVKYCCNNFSQK